MNGLTETLVIAFLTIVFSISLHEKGHADKAEKFGLKVREEYRFKTWKFWEWKWTVITDRTPTPTEEKEIILAGIILGLLPIVVSFLIIGWWSLFALLLYFSGIKSDIKRFFEVLGDGATRNT